jgi:hypothetical protein
MLVNLVDRQGLNIPRGKILSWVTLALMSLFLYQFLVFQWGLIRNPFPNEYREGAILLTTQALLDGKNPYALVNQPEYTNVYGILYHLVVYPFAKVFGNSFPVHRSVSAGFIWASCGLMFWIMRWMRIPLVLNLGTTMILLGHLLFYITALARPDAMGVFLLLLSVVLPFRFGYSDRSLYIAILCGILAFLVKPYCILGLAFLLLYVLVWRSPKRGLHFGAVAALGLGLTVAGMSLWGDCYINNTFLIHVNVATRSTTFLHLQLHTYAMANLSLLALLGVGLGWGWQSHFKRLVKQRTIGLFPWCALLSFGIFYLSLGRHTENWIVYLYQLFSPFCLLTMAMAAKSLYCCVQPLWKQYLVNVLLVINLASVASADSLPKLPEGYQASWQALSQLTATHQRILSSPLLTSLLIKEGKPVYDSGQSEYFIQGVAEKTPLTRLLPNRAKLIERNNAYVTQIEQDISQKAFDLVVLTQNHSTLVSEKFLRQYYEKKRSITAVMPPTPFKGPRTRELDIYEPKVQTTPTLGNPPKRKGRFPTG